MKPLRQSNFSTAWMSPRLPSWMRSSSDRSGALVSLGDRHHEAEVAVDEGLPGDDPRLLDPAQLADAGRARSAYRQRARRELRVRPRRPGPAGPRPPWSAVGGGRCRSGTDRTRSSSGSCARLLGTSPRFSKPGRIGAAASLADRREWLSSPTDPGMSPTMRDISTLPRLRLGAPFSPTTCASMHGIPRAVARRRLAKLVPAGPTRRSIESAIFPLDRLESHEPIHPFSRACPLLGPRRSPGAVGCPGAARNHDRRSRSKRPPCPTPSPGATSAAWPQPDPARHLRSGWRSWLDWRPSLSPDAEVVDGRLRSSWFPPASSPPRLRRSSHPSPPQSVPVWPRSTAASGTPSSWPPCAAALTCSSPVPDGSRTSWSGARSICHSWTSWSSTKPTGWPTWAFSPRYAASSR